MTRILPYRVVPDGLVEVDAWHVLLDDEEPRTLGDHLPDWDYNTELRLARQVDTDPRAVIEACALPETSRLGWSVVWRAVDSKLTNCTPPMPLASASTVLTAVIAGQELGVAIELSTRIVLVEEAAAVQPAVASAPGSILWNDTTRVNLIGDAARFPAAVIDFGLALLDPDASLALEIDDDLDAPLLGGLQLLINARDADLVEAVSRPVGRSEVRAQLIAGVDEFVISQLLDFARRRSSELETFDGEEDSIGGVCRTLIDQTVSLKQLTADYQWRHARYQTVLIGEGRRRGMGRQLP